MLLLSLLGELLNLALLYPLLPSFLTLLIGDTDAIEFKAFIFAFDIPVKPEFSLFVVFASTITILLWFES